MSHLMLAGFIGFIGAFLGLLAAGLLIFLWAKKRVLTLQARLVTRVASGDLSLRSLIAALRMRRHVVTIAMVRRQLRTDVEQCSAAVAEAERLGAAEDGMGMRSAELEVAARELDSHLARIPASRIDPVLVSRAGDLGIAAHRLRRDALRLAGRSSAVGLPAPARRSGGQPAAGPHPSQR